MNKFKRAKSEKISKSDIASEKIKPQDPMQRLIDLKFYVYNNIEIPNSHFK